MKFVLCCVRAFKHTCKYIIFVYEYMRYARMHAPAFHSYSSEYLTQLRMLYGHLCLTKLTLQFLLYCGSVGSNLPITYVRCVLYIVYIYNMYVDIHKRERHFLEKCLKGIFDVIVYWYEVLYLHNCPYSIIMCSQQFWKLRSTNNVVQFSSNVVKPNHKYPYFSLLYYSSVCPSACICICELVL